MRDRLDELGESTEVVLITFTDLEALAEYRDRNALPFTVVSDADRAAYRVFGLGRGSVARVWGWRAGLRYVGLLRDSGLRALRRPTEDTLQLGGDFVVATGLTAFEVSEQGQEVLIRLRAGTGDEEQEVLLRWRN